MNLTLYCLHGNLQHASVWERFRGSFERASNGKIQLEPEDIWHTSAESLWNWAESFCRKVEKRADREAAVLLGYSLGGRLALHAILQRPELWRAAVIVGANFGIKDPAVREARYQADLKRGQQFITEPWETLMAQWDANPVFCGRPFQGKRREKDFSKEKIRRLFDIFSVGKQEYLLPRFADISSLPILYVSGEEDKTYAAIGEQFAATCPTATHQVIANAGHRAPWDNPDEFSQVVTQFLQ